MAVREFSDERGRGWRAWEIKPEAIHPQTKAEDYLADCYTIGWIVFERTNGEEKRRLCPYPIRWSESSDVELQALLSSADVVPPHKLDAQRRTAGDVPRPVDTVDAVTAAPPDITDLEVVRSFRYPGGRLWTVCMIRHPESGGPPVLRFTAGVRSLDLERWPIDWADARDETLVELLRSTAPRDSQAPVAGAPRRRWNDLPASAPAS